MKNRMYPIAGLIAVLSLLIASSGAHAVDLPQNFNLDGMMTDAAGVPLASPQTVTFTVYDPSGSSCLLYEETQTVTLDSQGVFSVKVGAGTKTGNDPGLQFKKIFENRNQVRINGAGCSAGYTPATGDGRVLVMKVGSTVLSALQLSPVPMASVAESLQGMVPSDLLQVGTVANLSQSNVENVFSATNYPLLTALLAGSSSQYMSTTGANGASLPSYSSNPSSPAAGNVWYDSTSNVMKFYNGTTVQTVGTGGGGTVTSVIAGTGLSGGSITSAGVISMPSVGSAGTYTKVTTDAQGRVISGTTLSGGDLPAGVLTNGGNAIATNLTVGSTDSFPVDFISNNLTRMSIGTTGNVGVGTTTASSLLHVAGEARVDGSIYGANPSGPLISLYSGGNYGQFYSSQSNSWSFGYNTNRTTNGTPIMTWMTTGNVGVGTTSAVTKFQVGSSSDPVNELMVASNSTGRAALIVTSNANITMEMIANYSGAPYQGMPNGASGILTGNPSPFVIALNSTERFRISDTTGNVGIGSAAPAVALDLTGKNDAIRFPSGGNGTRPASPANGDLRYNLSLGDFEGYMGGQWIGMHQQPAHGMQTFTSGGTFTVPPGVTQVKVTAIGAAGGGYSTGMGGAGGAGVAYLVGLTPSSTVTISVGTGGNNSASPGNGTASSFGTYVVASGGVGSTGGQGAPGSFTVTPSGGVSDNGYATQPGLTGFWGAGLGQMAQIGGSGVVSIEW